MSVHYLPILNLKSKDFTVFLIPNEVLARYVAHLDMRGIDAAHQGQYKKWLRYYLEFCDKYPIPAGNSDRVRLFCEKLREKNTKKNKVRCLRKGQPMLLQLT